MLSYRIILGFLPMQGTLLLALLLGFTLVRWLSGGGGGGGRRGEERGGGGGRKGEMPANRGGGGKNGERGKFKKI